MLNHKQKNEIDGLPQFYKNSAIHFSGIETEKPGRNLGGIAVFCGKNHGIAIESTGSRCDSGDFQGALRPGTPVRGMLFAGMYVYYP